ncbi:bcl-2-related ovarian killer protein homolog B [Condylostylus longicornis]|uniref:bcl-2-related ovarian killer protein homolog B n=1 Tax=Condylostylus longicornis TaxID=2530218 RepID=UPI00244DCCD7|nr:bcl-2-related ovarian killer protein homolog B [Condylostylus longicornis]
MPFEEEYETFQRKPEWKARKQSNVNESQEYKKELVEQGRCLCSYYIRNRLRRAGLLNKKVTQRLRFLLEPSSDVVYDVFPALNTMGEELERMHPRLYSNVSRQLSRAPFGELEDCDTAPMLLNLVAKELLKNNITWGKIISIFAICGGFGIDCVRQGHYDFLQFLIDGFTELIEDDLLLWLSENGGWIGLLKHIRQKNTQFTLLGWLTIFVIFNIMFYFISNIAKQIGCHLYSSLF